MFRGVNPDPIWPDEFIPLTPTPTPFASLETQAEGKSARTWQSHGAER